MPGLVLYHYQLSPKKKEAIKCHSLEGIVTRNIHESKIHLHCFWLLLSSLDDFSLYSINITIIFYIPCILDLFKFLLTWLFLEYAIDGLRSVQTMIPLSLSELLLALNAVLVKKIP